LLVEEWEYELRTSPEMATALGDSRYNNRLDDDSPQFHLAGQKQNRDFLARFEALNPTGLSSQDALSRELMIRKLRETIEGAQFKPWEMPVTQMRGIHLSLIEMGTFMPFKTVGDYENYVARLHQVPNAFEQTISNMRQGMKDRLMPPRYLLEKVTVQAEDLASKSGESSPFAKPVQAFPANIAPAEQSRLRSAVLAAIDGEIVPAYRKFAVFVRTDYAPHGRTDPGVWALPDGAARYRFAIRRMTTTDLSPEQIHEIGVKQLAETEAEMLTLAHNWDSRIWRA